MKFIELFYKNIQKIMNLNDLQLLTKANQFASIKHRTQRRKGGDKQTPYINHPIEVCNILAQCGISDTKILCGALLHDTIEDTQTTEEQILKQFGEDVLKYVLECSDDKNLGKIQRKIHQIEHSLHILPGSKYIKIADKLSNNRSLLLQGCNAWSSERLFGYHLWSQAVYKNLVVQNAELNNQMRQVFQKAGVYKLSEQQRKKRLEQYYELLQGLD